MKPLGLGSACQPSTSLGLGLTDFYSLQLGNVALSDIWSNDINRGQRVVLAQQLLSRAVSPPARRGSSEMLDLNQTEEFQGLGRWFSESESLLCKHEGLSLDPQHPHAKLGWFCVCL